MSAATTEYILPHPPAFLVELLGLSVSSDSNPSIYCGDDVNGPMPVSAPPLRPFVTLTFAQSLDGKIAGAGGQQLILSGRDSMVMTHWMRTLHDAILIGIGTAAKDDPQLNTRHLPPLPSNLGHKYSQPRPVILDTHLRLSPDCKLLKNYRAGRGRRPWVICGGRASAHEESLAVALEAGGARVIEVGMDDKTGLMGVEEVLRALRSLGMRSLMVEGGARVIRTFLSAAVVDAMVVTVAPRMVGEGGVGYELAEDKIPTFKHVRTLEVGCDAVLAMVSA